MRPHSQNILVGQMITPDPPPVGCVAIEMECDNALCRESAEIFLRGAVTVDFARGLTANCPVCGSPMRSRSFCDPRRRITTRIIPSHKTLPLSQRGTEGDLSGEADGVRNSVDGSNEPAACSLKPVVCLSDLEPIHRGV